VVRPPRPPDDSLEEAICEAVFRYQLRQPLADAPQPLGYYLARLGRDPDDACLRRLRALAPGVQPLSRCRVSARDGVVDRVTGGRGVIVQVTRLTWVHAAAVDVVGGISSPIGRPPAFATTSSMRGATGLLRPSISSGEHDPLHRHSCAPFLRDPAVGVSGTAPITVAREWDDQTLDWRRTLLPPRG
jgi:hypothetical protein